MRRSHFLLQAMFAVAIAPTGCTATSGPTNIGGLITTVHDQRIELKNQTAKLVFPFVIGQNAAAYTDWYPCVDATRCPSIKPGATLVVPYPSQMIGADEKAVIVYWWHAEQPASGPARADSVRSAIVRI